MPTINLAHTVAMCRKASMMLQTKLLHDFVAMENIDRTLQCHYILHSVTSLSCRWDIFNLEIM